MSKRKAGVRPPRHVGIISDLITEARGANWDFNNWCSASGYEVSDPYARRMFEYLLAYAKREGGAGLH